MSETNGSERRTSDSMGTKRARSTSDVEDRESTPDSRSSKKVATEINSVSAAQQRVDGDENASRGTNDHRSLETGAKEIIAEPYSAGSWAAINNRFSETRETPEVDTTKATSEVNGVSTGPHSDHGDEAAPEVTFNDRSLEAEVTKAASEINGVSRSSSPETEDEDDSLFVGQDPADASVTDINDTSATEQPARESEDLYRSTPGHRSPETLDPGLDENGCVLGYDAKKEGLPTCAFYSPAFTLAEGDATRACDIVLNAYAETVKVDGYHSEEMEIVCGTFGKLDDHRIPSQLYDAVGPIAILGPTGSGKSSATNSILSQQKAAFEHDGDGRETYLVHEYRCPQPNQISRFRVVATYFSMEDIFRDIKRYYNDIIEDTDADEVADENENEDASDEKLDTALRFFTDLLAHRKEFQTDEATSQYFMDRAEEEKTTVCEELHSFVKQFLASRKAYSNGEEIYDADNGTELNDIFKQVCRPIKINAKARVKQLKRGSPWPILRKVVVHQSIPLLEAGVILADTPGVHDRNLAVVQNTTRYLKTAGTILIFLPYMRLEANTVLDQLLRDCIALGKMNNIRLVVTMIDDMKPLDEDELDAEEQACLHKAKRTLERLSSEIRETTTAKKQAKGTDRYEELDGQLESLELRKVKAAAAVKQTTIEIRCRDLENKLKNKLKKIFPSANTPELPVSFISNTQYRLHVDGYEAGQAPFLDLAATGIPRLRQILLAIPTKGKFSRLQGLANNVLPNILRGIDGILTTSKLERMQEVRRTLRLVLGKHHGDPVVTVVRDLRRAFDERVATTIKESLPEWKDEAQDKLVQWSELKAMTFRGVCSRGGEWHGHSTGDINWNRELIDISANKLVNSFNELAYDATILGKDLSTSVQALFEDLCTTVLQSAEAQGNVLEPFLAYIKGTAVEVIRKIMEQFEVLQGSIDHIRGVATLDVEGSFFVSGMKETYGKATLLSAKNQLPARQPPPTKGKAGGKRRLRTPKLTVGGARQKLILERIRGETDEESVFLSVGRLCSDDLDIITKDWADRCNEITKAAYDDIVQYFKSHFQEDEVKEEPNPVAVEKMKKAVREAMNIVQCSMKQHLAACEAYARGGS